MAYYMTIVLLQDCASCMTINFLMKKNNALFVTCSVFLYKENLVLRQE